MTRFTSSLHGPAATDHKSTKEYQRFCYISQLHKKTMGNTASTWGEQGETGWHCSELSHRAGHNSSC